MADWKIPGYFKGDADKVYEEISTLDAVTPENILKKARDNRTELHKCIEWDDTVAAKKFRLIQARQIIQMLVVTPRQEEEQSVRIFQISSTTNEYKENQFFIQNKDEYQILLQKAKGELRAIKARYKMLSELETVFDAIDQI